MKESAITLVLSREQSSMVSTWEEHLALVKQSGDAWGIGTYGYVWLGSIYELIPEEERYSEAGELLVPETWDGHKIIGLADGEYLQTDELVTADDLEFTPETLEEAREFCESRGWADHPRFDLAWLHIEAAVKPSQALSRMPAFKDMPLLRAGSSASPGGYCSSELAIFRGHSETELWVWNSESESECLFKTVAVLSFGQIVSKVADNDCFSVEVDWSDLDIAGVPNSLGILLASAWAFDEGSRTAARLIAKIPDQTLLPFLARVALDGAALSGMGQRLLHYACAHNVSLDEIGPIKLRHISDLQGLEKSLRGVLFRASHGQANAAADREALKLFEAEITRLIDAYRRDKPKRYYPGAGYVVPPLGVLSLREFLTRHVRQHRALPTGVVQIPYSNQEMSKPSSGTFIVDFDSLYR